MHAGGERPEKRRDGEHASEVAAHHEHRQHDDDTSPTHPDRVTAPHYLTITTSSARRATDPLTRDTAAKLARRAYVA